MISESPQLLLPHLASKTSSYLNEQIHPAEIKTNFNISQPGIYIASEAGITLSVTKKRLDNKVSRSYSHSMEARPMPSWTGQGRVLKVQLFAHSLRELLTSILVELESGVHFGLYLARVSNHSQPQPPPSPKSNQWTFMIKVDIMRHRHGTCLWMPISWERISTFQ